MLRIIYLFIVISCISCSVVKPRISVDNNVDKDEVELRLRQRCLKSEDLSTCIIATVTSLIGESYETNDTLERTSTYEMKTKAEDVNEEQTSRTFRINRRTATAMMIGLVLKKLGLIPLILGKLSLLGAISMISSNLSLLISVIMILKKFFGSAGGYVGSSDSSYSHYGHSHYGHGGGAYKRKDSYIPRGRQMFYNWDPEQKTDVTSEGPQLPRPDIMFDHHVTTRRNKKL